MSTKRTMLSGVQPTNKLTLGNYIGAIKNWVRLQEQFRSYFMVVDMHSITVRQDPAQLRENTWAVIASYVAAGIDPERCTLFIQSHVKEHAELAWILNCHAYMGELNRMTQFKDKSQRAGENIPAGLFTYPTLMAADILLYDVHAVPVGDDQKQHIELTRDLAIRMNNRYGEDTFVVPEPFLPKVGGRIMDLQEPTKKMSKSDSNEGGALYLTDTPKEIEKKVKRATTDSGSEITYDESKPGIRNLLNIQSAITGKPVAEIVESYVGKQYGYLKVDTAAIVVEELRPLQEKMTELLNDKGELTRILARGAEKAREQAAKTVRKVYDRVGFIPASF